MTQHQEPTELSQEADRQRKLELLFAGTKGKHITFFNDEDDESHHVDKGHLQAECDTVPLDEA